MYLFYPYLTQKFILNQKVIERRFACLSNMKQL